MSFRELLCLAAAVLAWVGVSAQSAGERPLWYDEIFTFVGSGIGSLSEIVDLLMLGFDPTPVVFYGISSLVRSLGPPEMMLRLPAIVGFAVGMASVYLAARKSAGWGYSALAAAVPVMLFGDLNLEARPYGLVLGFAGLALLGWTYRDRPSGAGLFFLGIAGAASCHYYAFLVGLPFGIAALWQVLRSRKLDLLTFGGAFLALVPNLLALPLIRADLAIHSPAAWNAPSWRALLMSSYSVELALLTVLVMLLLWRGLPAIEADVICWLGFGALPFVGTLLAKTVSGLIHPRYTSMHTLGVGLMMAWSLARLLPRVRLLDYAAGGLALAGLIAGLFLQAEKTSDARLGTNYMVSEIAALLERPEFQKATLALPDALLALPVSFYSSPQLRDRIVFPADSKLALRYMNNNSVHVAQERLHPYLHLRTEEFVPYFGRASEDILILDAAYFPGRGSSFFHEYLADEPALAARAEVVRDYPFGEVILLRAVKR